MSGFVLSSSVVEAPKWRTDRAERRARKAGCLSKGLSVRDGSHLNVPKGFDQNGPLLRREVSKYRHISSPSLLALGHFASNLDDAGTVYGPLLHEPVIALDLPRTRGIGAEEVGDEFVQPAVEDRLDRARQPVAVDRGEIGRA